MFGIKTRVKNSFKMIITKRFITAKIKNAIKISDNVILYDSKKLCDKKIAIHIHVFYTDLLDEIFTHLVNIQNKFTLFLTTTTEKNVRIIEAFFNKNVHSHFEVKIILVENRGRDIYPFYQALKPFYNNYEIIGHLHTKKSLHSSRGDMWRQYLFNNLFGKNYFFDNLVDYLENNKDVGFVVPPPMNMEGLPSIYLSFLNNTPDFKENISKTLHKFNQDSDKLLYSSEKNLDFPCGNMFIAKTEAIKQFFEKDLVRDDFPEEAGQLAHTLQHYVESIWIYFVLANGFKYVEILNSGNK